jgi:hypothetical protein
MAFDNRSLLDAGQSLEMSPFEETSIALTGPRDALIK